MEVFRADPFAPNSDIAAEIGRLNDSVRTLVGRLKKSGKIVPSSRDGKRYVMVVAEPPKSNRKINIYNHMLDVYLGDFDDANNFDERTRVGSLVLRILEKI